MAMSRRFLNRLALAISITVLSLAASAPSASASVTIGQLGDPNAGNCAAGFEFMQLGGTSGKLYVVPGNGTVTSWTMQADTAGDVTMKIFRKLADPATFQVVGHAGPERLTAGGIAGNTFAASVAVRPGDLLGLQAVTDTPCGFKDPAGQQAIFSGDLADGESAAFGPDTGSALDIQAAFVPSNAFTRGVNTRNKKKGTATLNVNLPNPGDLSASGTGAKVSSAGAMISKAVQAGPAQLLIKAKGKQRKTLNATGKVKLNIAVTYTPTGGDPHTQSVKVKLKKKL